MLWLKAIPFMYTMNNGFVYKHRAMHGPGRGNPDTYSVPIEPLFA